MKPTELKEFTDIEICSLRKETWANNLKKEVVSDLSMAVVDCWAKMQ
jgi:hypothetical protein